MSTTKNTLTSIGIAIVFSILFFAIDWGALVDAPLPVLIQPSSDPSWGEYYSAAAATVADTVLFVSTLVFGMFVAIGASLHDGFSPNKKVTWTQLGILSIFFFAAFISFFFAYKTHIGLMTQIGFMHLDMKRLESSISMQALFATIAGFFTFAFIAFSLLSHETDNS